jgi:uncharacterized protein YbjT (DUF2867 family)
MKMKRYAVVGASSGTGLALVHYLASKKLSVRAISRHPPSASDCIEPATADVTDPQAIASALAGDFSAVFFTADIHGLKSRDAVRSLMYHGCVNTIKAAAKNASAPKFVLLSVIGPETGSWVWGLLNTVKRGMKKNVLDREEALKASGLNYVICRAPKLNDNVASETPLAATQPQHKLDMKMGIPRADLARALVVAADSAPDRTTWDVFADARGPVPSWLAVANASLTPA